MLKVKTYDTARLITEEEWYGILAAVPNVPVERSISWYLHDVDAKGRQAYVTEEGEVRRCKRVDERGIRPLFKISGFSVAGAERGERIKVGSFYATVCDVFKPGPGQSVPIIHALAEASIMNADGYAAEDTADGAIMANVVSV